jgi:hypothetical protein
MATRSQCPPKQHPLSDRRTTGMIASPRTRNLFEWLEEPNTLDPYIVDALNTAQEEKPGLLHIGCGTSPLSYHLRSHVKDPKQTHNLDYSDVAIELGKRQERAVYKWRMCQRKQEMRIKRVRPYIGQRCATGYMYWNVRTYRSSYVESTYEVKANHLYIYDIDCIFRSDVTFIVAPYSIST